MKNFLQKIKDIYSKFSIKGEINVRRGIEPSRDWSIILLISFLIFIVLIVFAYYVYNQVKNDLLFVAPKSDLIKDVKINTDLLEKIVADVDQREEETSKLKGSAVLPADPSI